MQFVFSLATGILWSWAAVLELTGTFSAQFAFSPIRSALIATFGVVGLVIASMEYLWQLWFARMFAVITLLFLVLAYWFPLMPENASRIPVIATFVAWILFAVVAGYEKSASSIAHLSQK